MTLFTQQYIENALRGASYELDPATNQWCAWIDSLPGIYAQSGTVEEVRAQLAEVIEDYLLVSLYNRHLVPELERFARPSTYGSQTNK